MSRTEDFNKEFVVLRAQFLTQDNMFPTSEHLGDLTEFMHRVLEDSALHMKAQAVPRKWVITHPKIVDSLASNFLVGTLGYIKHRPRHVFNYELLEFMTSRQEDAELLHFVFDGKRELLAIQTSTFPEITVADRFQDFFRLASPIVRKNRALVLYSIPLGDDVVAAIEGKTVRRFVVKIRRPNADLSGVFKKLFEGNASDEVDLTWWNRAEELKMQVTGLFASAIEAVRGGFGEWIAHVRVGKRLQTIRSSTETIRQEMNVTSDVTLVLDAEACFARIEKLVGGNEDSQ